MRKTLFTMLLSLLAFGCQTTGESDADAIRISEILVVNASNGPIYDIELRVEQFRQKFGCNFLPPGGECGTAFPPRPYRANWVILAWRQDGHQNRSDRFRIRPRPGLDASTELIGIVTLFNRGRFRAAIGDREQRL